MRAVIFAAGLGTRLRPLTDQLPKPLIDVGGKTILQRTIEALPASIAEAIVVVGYKKEMIQEALKAFGGLPIRFVEQPGLRGTYDALLRTKPFLKGGFLALNGDDLYAKEDLERLAATDGFAMLAHRVPAPNPYSHLEAENGFLHRITLNKDSMRLSERLVYVGACRLDPQIFDLVPGQAPNGELGLPHTLERHREAHPVRVLESTFWLPVGTPEELKAARRTFGPS